MSETLSLVLESLPDLLSGARFTVLLSLGGMFFGLLLGFLLALGRLYACRPIQWLVRFYVSFFRGTPLLVQLFIIYYGLPEIGLQLDPLPAAIAQIDAGQWEAAASLGMNRRQTLRRIIVPQAARTALPPLGNSFIALVKDTSLAATIQVPELLRQSQLITARTFEVFAMYISAALIYWAIASILSALQARLERHTNRSEAPESGG